MVDIVGRDVLFPFIAAVIYQFQPPPGVLQAYARAAAVSIVLGVVGVVAGEHQLAFLLLQADVDGGRTTAADTVLEGILDERDEQQRGDFMVGGEG